MNLPSSWLFTALVLLAALSRLLPHPPNFTPLGAIALFSPAAFNNGRLGLSVAIVAMFLSDLFLGFHATMWAVYLSFFIAGLLGLVLRHYLKPLPILGATLLSSVVFFLLTNFAVWLEGLLYPLTWQGLVECYVAALPFYRNSLAGDLFFTTLLFSISYIVLKPFHWLPAHWATRP